MKWLRHDSELVGEQLIRIFGLGAGQLTIVFPISSGGRYPFKLKEHRKSPNLSPNLLCMGKQQETAYLVCVCVPW